MYEHKIIFVICQDFRKKVRFFHEIWWKISTFFGKILKKSIFFFVHTSFITVKKTSTHQFWAAERFWSSFWSYFLTFSEPRLFMIITLVLHCRHWSLSGASSSTKSVCNEFFRNSSSRTSCVKKSHPFRIAYSSQKMFKKLNVNISEKLDILWENYKKIQNFNFSISKNFWNKKAENFLKLQNQLRAAPRWCELCIWSNMTTYGARSATCS